MMIGIVDSGSTTSKWCFINTIDSAPMRFAMPGINPTTSLDISFEADIFEQIDLGSVAEFYWYGSGVNSEETRLKIKSAIQEHFTNLHHFEIHNDLMAACRATAKDTEAFVGILGTGSNACYFDGKHITDNIASLGYLFDDYGSGFDLGRRVIISFFGNKMSNADHDLFVSKYGDGKTQILSGIYTSDTPNRKLASYAEFLGSASEELGNKIATEGFMDFFKYKVVPLQESPKEIHFVGSVANRFKKELKQCAEHYGFSLGKVLKGPIEELVNYHKKHGRTKD